MIMPLVEALELDANIEQDDLDALESSVRALTNNNFQNTKVRFRGLGFIDDKTLQVKDPVKGLRQGDTIEINYSLYNDGLYEIEQISGQDIQVKGSPFFVDQDTGAIGTLVKYPPDIKRGLKKLIAYDKKMGPKAGIKSETLSRMSTTYYDVNASENTEGYPSALLSFLKKYQKMRW